MAYVKERPMKIFGFQPPKPTGFCPSHFFCKMYCLEIYESIANYKSQIIEVCILSMLQLYSELPRSTELHFYELVGKINQLFKK
jgi:hypothetical protein